MSELGRWVREELDLAEGETVTVVEQAGTHAGCAFETVVTVGPSGDEESFVVTFHKPVAEIERMDLLAALAFGEH